jgi:hypothetical protein
MEMHPEYAPTYHSTESHPPTALTAVGESSAATARLAEEMNAMEAVRELLFGKRVTEFHQMLQQTEDRLSAAVHRLEMLTEQRFAEMERRLSETAQQFQQLVATEQVTRQQELHGFRKSAEHRFGQGERYVETLAKETARQLEIRRAEMEQVKAELTQETQLLRQTTPTTESLADLFQKASQRLKSTLEEDRAPVRNASLRRGQLDREPTEFLAR